MRAGGWLPYTLRINFRTVESLYPNGFTMDATGDLEGKGIWTFEPDEPFVDVTYDWTMKSGKESLKLELLRRLAKSPEELARIPPPPRPSLVVRILSLDK